MDASVLFRDAMGQGREPEPDTDADPDYFADLHLDQILAELNRHCEVELNAWFRRLLCDPDDIAYRQSVFAELQRSSDLRSGLDAYVQAMHRLRSLLDTSEKRWNQHEREGWFLHAVTHYLAALDALADCLSSAPLRAAGLSAVRDHLTDYLSSEGLHRLRADSERVAGMLDGVRYAVRIKGPRVSVTIDEVPTEDFSAHLDRTFQRLAQHAVDSRLITFPTSYGLDGVEADILDRVARLCPEPFTALSSFAQRHADFLDATLSRFDAEIQFYLAYLTVLDHERARGAQFTLPQIAELAAAGDAPGHTTGNATDLDEFGSEMIDLALAISTERGGASPVSNDFTLAGPERVLVISGPNQGGKTTFARSVGQIYHLAALGCPVAAARARLAVPDRIFTHFERMEEHGDIGGKLEDDLRRIHRVLEQVSERSVVIINEMFTSTTLSDAEFLGEEIIGRLASIGSRGVYVTFVDRLATLGPHTVSMLSMTAEDDPTLRTFKVARHEPGGEIYAQVIARRYGLNRQHIVQEVRS